MSNRFCHLYRGKQNRSKWPHRNFISSLVSNQCLWNIDVIKNKLERVWGDSSMVKGKSSRRSPEFKKAHNHLLIQRVSGHHNSFTASSCTVHRLYSACACPYTRMHTQTHTQIEHKGKSINFKATTTNVYHKKTVIATYRVCKLFMLMVSSCVYVCACICVSLYVCNNPRWWSLPELERDHLRGLRRKMLLNHT